MCNIRVFSEKGYEKRGHNRGFKCSGNRPFTCIKSSPNYTFLDSCNRGSCSYCNSKANVWRFRSEFYEPSLSGKSGFTCSIYRANDQLDKSKGVDAISTATPLEIAKNSLIGATADVVGGATQVGDVALQAAEMPTYLQLFLGQVGGCIGETSALALLLGALYLLARKVIGLQIPLTFIGTTALFTWIFGGDPIYRRFFIPCTCRRFDTGSFLYGN